MFKIVAKSPGQRIPQKQAELMRKVFEEEPFPTKSEAIFYLKLLPAWQRDLLEVSEILPKK